MKKIISSALLFLLLSVRIQADHIYGLRYREVQHVNVVDALSRGLNKLNTEQNQTPNSGSLRRRKVTSSVLSLNGKNGEFDRYLKNKIKDNDDIVLYNEEDIVEQIGPLTGEDIKVPTLSPVRSEIKKKSPTKSPSRRKPVNKLSKSPVSHTQTPQPTEENEDDEISSDDSISQPSASPVEILTDDSTKDDDDSLGDDAKGNDDEVDLPNDDSKPECVEQDRSSSRDIDIICEENISNDSMDVTEENISNDSLDLIPGNATIPVGLSPSNEGLDRNGPGRPGVGIPGLPGLDEHVPSNDDPHTTDPTTF